MDVALGFSVRKLKELLPPGLFLSDSATFPLACLKFDIAGINTAVCVYFFACIFLSHELSAQLQEPGNYHRTRQQREQINSKH